LTMPCRRCRLRAPRHRQRPGASITGEAVGFERDRPRGPDSRPPPPEVPGDDVAAAHAPPVLRDTCSRKAVGPAGEGGLKRDLAGRGTAAVNEYRRVEWGENRSPTRSSRTDLRLTVTVRGVRNEVPDSDRRLPRPLQPGGELVSPYTPEPEYSPWGRRPYGVSAAPSGGSAKVNLESGERDAGRVSRGHRDSLLE